MKYGTGIKFNKLNAIKFIERKSDTNYWLFKCDCGIEKILDLNNVKTGNTKSCGCLQRELTHLKNKKSNHGMSYTKFYRIFSGILTRCLNKKNHSYKDYGGRGIKCIWNSFDEFKNDMYESYMEHIMEFPKNTSIERIDNNGNYCK